MKIQFDISSLTKNCNEALILSILYAQKCHGYQIARKIEERSKGIFKFNHGTLYPILHKLEKEGFIKGTWRHEGPKRKRKYYALTVKGRKYMSLQLIHWRQFFQQFFNIFGETEE